ncbi:MAG: hypothetical protein ACE5EQ_05760 [Phycisphaerae bacterium]
MSTSYIVLRRRGVSRQTTGETPMRRIRQTTTTTTTTGGTPMRLGFLDTRLLLGHL